MHANLRCNILNYYWAKFNPLPSNIPRQHKINIMNIFQEIYIDTKEKFNTHKFSCACSSQCSRAVNNWHEHEGRHTKIPCCLDESS